MNINLSKEIHDLVSRYGKKNAQSILTDVNFSTKIGIIDIIEANLEFFCGEGTFNFSKPFTSVIFDFDIPKIVNIERASFNDERNVWWLFDKDNESYAFIEMPNDCLLRMLEVIRKQMIQLEK